MDFFGVKFWCLLIVCIAIFQAAMSMPHELPRAAPFHHHDAECRGRGRNRGGPTTAAGTTVAGTTVMPTTPASTV